MVAEGAAGQVAARRPVSPLTLNPMTEKRNYYGYDGAKQNPNGTWVCGGEYDGAKQTPDGTWVCGGLSK